MEEGTAHSVLSNHAEKTTDADKGSSVVFSKAKNCKKSIECEGQKLSWKVIARIQIPKTNKYRQTLQRLE